MAKPVFLVGWRRSGTTWLGALIAQNTNIASIMGGKAGGQGGCVESYYFSHLYGKFGDLKDYNNLICLIEVFGSSTYFELSGFTKDFLYKERPETYEGLFRRLMDRYAETKGAELWLEKNPSHSFHVEEIARCYEDAKFIAIERDVVSQLRSALKMNELEGIEMRGLKKALSILKEIVGNCTAQKHINRLQSKHPKRVLVVSYEELVKSRKEVITAICDFLGVTFEPAMLESPYKAGSSFVSGEEKKGGLSNRGASATRIIFRLCTLLPYRFYWWLYRRAKKMQGLHFPHWFFSTKIEHYKWDDLLDPRRMRDVTAKSDDS